MICQRATLFPRPCKQNMKKRNFNTSDLKENESTNLKNIDKIIDPIIFLNKIKKNTYM